MKYLKLFEAFESQILTKTLGFINKGERANFIDKLRRICNNIDFPFSKLSDDFFSYLPFSKALKLNAMTGDEPCDATSERAFPQYAVEGATCKDGKIMRKWGARTREVECPICSGTGIKKKKPEIKLIKFWFNSEGKFITQTAVDGIIRKSNTERFPDEQLRLVRTTNDPRSLNTGDIIKVRIRNNLTKATVVKSGSMVYAIQNSFEGTTPGGSTNWRQYGRLSWQLSSGEYSGDIQVLEPISQDIPTEPDPYTWNAYYDLGRYNMSVNDSRDVRELIKDAHFAITLDFGKLKLSGYKPKSEISSEREERKSDATAFMTDEEAREKNIERYTKAISDKLTSGDNLTNITKSVSRIFGSNWSFYYLLGNRQLSTFNQIITYLYKFMKEDESDKDYWSEQIVRNLKNIYNNNSEFNTKMVNNTNTVRKSLSTLEGSESQLEILNKIDELSSKINEKILKRPVENIDDLEYIYGALSNIFGFIRSSDRGKLYKIQNYYERLYNYNNPDRALQSLSDISTYADSIIEDLNRLSRMIDKY